MAAPKTFTLKVHRQSFGVVSHTLAAGGPTPALLHRMCTAPYSSNAASASASTDSMLVTSVTTPIDLGTGLAQLCHRGVEGDLFDVREDQLHAFGGECVDERSTDS